MKNQLPRIITYLLILVVAFTLLQTATTPSVDAATPDEGLVDFTGFRLDARAVQVSPDAWEYYPDELYTPADLAQGTVGVPQYSGDSPEARYATYRLRMALPPGRIYTITGRSFHFSQRLYIDGVLVGEIGAPAATAAESVPHTKSYTYTFLAQNEVTELVFQAASFHHRQSAQNAQLVVGRPQVIQNYRALEFIQTNIVLGCLLMAGLHFAGMYIFFSSNRYFLYLGLVAFTIALRIALTGEKHLMDIFPRLSWFVAIRVEYMANLLFFVFLLLYFVNLYPDMLNRRLVGVTLAMSAVYGVLVLFTSTLFFTRALFIFTALWVFSSAYTMWKLARRLRRGDVHTALIFVGFATFFALALFDEVTYALTDLRLNNLMITGVLAGLFMNMIALALVFRRQEKELTESRTAIMISQIQPHFLFNTLSSIQDLCHEDPPKAEAAIGEFADYLRLNLDSLGQKEPILFESELKHVQNYLALEAHRMEERLTVRFDIGATGFLLPALTLQPLVENAVRHGLGGRKEGGGIVVASCETDRAWLVTVQDDGVGFDQTASRPSGGRSHVGIENVRQRLATMCGGRLDIMSRPGKGTTATITLPKGKARP